MRGRIIFMHPETKTGLIFGADRERYNFSLDQWTEAGTAPPRNLEVNFQVRGDQAMRIRPFVIDAEEEPLGELLTDNDPLAGLTASLAAHPATPPTAERAERRPPVVETSYQPADFGLEDPTLEDDIPDGLEDEEDPAPAGLRAPLTGIKPIPATSRILFAQDGLAAARRPAWKYYLFGVLAALVFIILAFLARHMFAS